MRISDSVRSQKIWLKVSYILIGFCLVPIGPPFLNDLGVNSEQLVLGGLLVLAPIYILIKGLSLVHVSRMLLISVLFAVLICGIAVMVTEVASLSFARMAINIALAYFFIQAIVLPLKNKNVPIEQSFCISVIFLIRPTFRSIFFRFPLFLVVIGIEDAIYLGVVLLVKFLESSSTFVGFFLWRDTFLGRPISSTLLDNLYLTVGEYALDNSSNPVRYRDLMGPLLLNLDLISLGIGLLESRTNFLMVD